jgi:hypothetical protein
MRNGSWWAVVALASLLGNLGAQPARPQQAIEGEIDAPKALKLLYGNYDPETQASRWKDSRAEKAFLDEAFVSEWATQEGMVDGKRQWFLYTIASPANNPDFTCHGCQLLFGAAMFQKEDRGWVVKADLIGVGSFGAAPMKPKPVQWGKQRFGLVVSDTYSGYGADSSDDTLFACKTTGECGIVFSIRTSYSNANSLAPDAEMIGWSADWSFARPGPTGMFDVVLKVTADNQRALTPAARKRGQGSPTPGVFRYDGKVYRRVGTQIELGK